MRIKDLEKEYLEKDRSFISNAMKIRFFPLVAEKATGCKITDVSGKEYIDFSASWSVAITGYCHPRVVDAVCRQAHLMTTNSHISIPHRVTIELAERLLNLFPGGFAKKIWFGHSGSEASDLIAKFVPLIKGRPKILSFEGSYHGQTSGAAALSGHQAQKEFASSSLVVKVPYPNPYRYKGSAEDCREYHLAKISKVLRQHPGEFAGLVVEPIQCDGGVVLPPDGFLSSLASLCKEAEMFYVIDEVKTGFGRTGKMFAFEYDSAVPDAVILGKPIASGIPLSAVVGREEILDAVPSGHMMTTAGNPVACAAALATLQVIQDEHLIERARSLGTLMMDKLRRLQDDYPVIGDVRGRGLLIGVELIAPETVEPDPGLAAKLCYRCKELGLIVFYVGTRSNVIEITPPLTISREECLEGLEIFETALHDVLMGRVSDKDVVEYQGW